MNVWSNPHKKKNTHSQFNPPELFLILSFNRVEKSIIIKITNGKVCVRVCVCMHAMVPESSQTRTFWQDSITCSRVLTDCLVSVFMVEFMNVFLTHFLVFCIFLVTLNTHHLWPAFNLPWNTHLSKKPCLQLKESFIKGLIEYFKVSIRFAELHVKFNAGTLHNLSQSFQYNIPKPCIRIEHQYLAWILLADWLGRLGTMSVDCTNISVDPNMCNPGILFH